MRNNKIDLCQAVTVFVNAKCNHITLAPAGTSLINNECTVTKLKTAMHTAGKIPFRTAAVSMKHQFNRCIRRIFIKISIQGKPVKRLNGKRFMWRIPCFQYPFTHSVMKRFVYLSKGQFYMLRIKLLSPRYIKNNLKKYVGNENCKQDYRTEYYKERKQETSSPL